MLTFIYSILFLLNVCVHESEQWELLSKTKQLIYNKHASFYYKAEDDSLWTIEVLEQSKKNPNKSVKLYEDESCPLFYSPKYDKICSTEKEVHEYILDKKITEEEDKYYKNKSAIILESKAKVIQVIQDGLIVELAIQKDKWIKITGHPLERVSVDEDIIYINALKYKGRFQYISVLGSVKTIDNYEYIEPFDRKSVKINIPKFETISGKDLFIKANSEGWKGLPTFTYHKMETTKGSPAKYRQEERTTALGARGSRTVLVTPATPPEYKFVWDIRYIPLK